jgi:hypothetical protein
VKEDLQSYYNYRKGTEAEELTAAITHVFFIAVRKKQAVFAEYF